MAVKLNGETARTKPSRGRYSTRLHNGDQLTATPVGSMEHTSMTLPSSSVAAASRAPQHTSRQLGRSP
jgi:hypothetical protein